MARQVAERQTRVYVRLHGFERADSARDKNSREALGEELVPSSGPSGFEAVPRDDDVLHAQVPCLKKIHARLPIAILSCLPPRLEARRKSKLDTLWRRFSRPITR
jgi:hypothetical protein